MPEPAPCSPDSTVPQGRPDHGAGLALAGFICGGSACIVGLCYALNYIALVRVPGLAGSEAGVGVWLVVLLLLVSGPGALVGLVLSFQGRHSTSRAWLARLGVLLSTVAALPFIVLLVAFYNVATYCSAHACF